jgi:enterochelin esterase-like enzyme
MRHSGTLLVAALGLMAGTVLHAQTGAATRRVTGDLRFDTLESRVFGNRRLLRVLLPAGYDDPANRNRRYPVLYLNDGQNLFDSMTAIFNPAEWRVDEAVDSLVRAGLLEPLIVVGIDNAGRAGRAHELLPFPDEFLSPPDPSPAGSRQPDFLIGEVVPLIERRYRVHREARHRALGGSSYGALAALYAAAMRPKVFGGLLLESPSFYVANQRIEQTVRRRRWTAERIYLGVGTNESGGACDDGSPVDGEAISGVRRMAAVLREAGAAPARMHVVVEECAEHAEEAWAGRLPGALKFLFPPSR